MKYLLSLFITFTLFLLLLSKPGKVWADIPCSNQNNSSSSLCSDPDFPYQAFVNKNGTQICICKSPQENQATPKNNLNCKQHGFWFFSYLTCTEPKNNAYRPGLVGCPGNSSKDCIVTALGAIPVDFSYFVEWVFRLLLSIGGGYAFLSMAMGGFLFMTSQGDPEKIKKAKEIFVSAITGLLFIILSTFILNLVGVKILQIPGFKS